MSDITTVAEAFAERRATQAEPAEVASGSEPDSAPAEAPVETPEVEAAAEEPEAQTPEVEADGTETAQADDGDSEPKGSSRLQRRLRKKIAALKDSEAKNAGLQEQFDALKAKVEEAVARKDGKKGDWLDGLLDKDEPAPKVAKSDDDVDPNVAEVRDRLYRMEVQAETVRLRSELAEVRKEHPSVPAELLLRAVQTDESVDLFDVAEQYDAWIDKQIKSREPGQAKDEPADDAAAARRPKGKSSGGGQPSKTNADKYSGAKSVRELFERRRASAAR